MKSKTHIIILHMKEIIYTVIFAALAVILIILLIYMFSHKKTEETMAAIPDYAPGVYTSSINLGDAAISVSVTVNKDGITDAALTDIDEATAAAYPLLATCMADISAQIKENVPLNQITYSSSNQYTVSPLLEAINNALSQAAP